MPEENDQNGAPSVDGDSPPSGSVKPPSSQPASGEAAEPADPLADAKAEAQRNTEQWMRTAADFDNFRKRTRRELDDARRSGREEMLKEFLPVFDNLERAIQSASRATDVKAVADGLNMIMRQFVDTLGRVNIAKVPTVGVQFDPSVHEAIQQIETDEHPPGAIVAEVQPGYVQGDRLVRPAMVVVAKAKQASAKEETGGSTEGG